MQFYRYNDLNQNKMDATLAYTLLNLIMNMAVTIKNALNWIKLD